MITLTDDEAKLLSFHLACRLDDYEDEIKREEKRQKRQLTDARKSHAEAQRLRLTKLNPSALCGKAILLDGSVIEP